MITGIARAMYDLHLACAAFRGNLPDAAILDGIKQFGADSHADVVLLLLEAVASGNTAASGIGADGMNTGKHPQDIKAGEPDSLSAQMAGSMVDHIQRCRIRFGKVQLSSFDAAQNAGISDLNMS